MEVIIGREANTSQLKITIGKQSKCLGANDSVPVTVSREHCKIELLDDDTYVIQNLNSRNSTFVNDVAILRKEISENDKIELGPDRFLLPWKEITTTFPKVIDIKPLKSIWEQYDEHRMDQQIADRKFNTLRSATGLITMTAIAISIVTKEHGPIYIALYALAIILSLAFTIKAYRDATNVPRKNKKLNDEFNNNYLCPQCGHHYNMNYNELSKYDACPFCKTKFKK